MAIVSIIMTTYNRAEMLRRSIQSVLGQTLKDFELIIVDDCSTDNTEEVVSGFKDNRIKYIRTRENSGGCLVPRDKGIEASKSKYIAVLDDDDFWVDSRKLELQVSFLDNNPGYVLVGTDVVATNGNHKIVTCFHYPRDDNSIRSKMLTQNCFFHSSVVYKAETISTIGGYVMQRRGFYSNYANDYDLWLRMGNIGRMVNLPIDGVGHSYSRKSVGIKDQIVMLVDRLRLIHKYRSCYPHYLTANIAVLVIALFVTPVLSPIKRYLSRIKG